MDQKALVHAAFLSIEVRYETAHYDVYSDGLGVAAHGCSGFSFYFMSLLRIATHMSIGSSRLTLRPVANAASLLPRCVSVANVLRHSMTREKDSCKVGPAACKITGEPARAKMLGTSRRYYFGGSEMPIPFLLFVTRLQRRHEQ